MLASIARLSLNRAAVDHARLSGLANGENKEREEAEQRQEQVGEGQMLRVRCRLPDAEGVSRAPSPAGKYQFPNAHETVQFVVAGTLVAAD